MPKVSVIIPNYNHATYLPQRIESVLNQTFQDFEIILMDDCSTDNSPEIIKQYQHHSKVSRVLLNEVNSGSTFKQWNKGIREAKGEYIWLAESDDYADPDFLEKLIPEMEVHPNAGIGYCHSLFVNEHNQIIGEWDCGKGTERDKKWQSNFVENGKLVIIHFMSLLNVIPNASAVLIRKKVYLEAGYANESYKLVGDWLLWIKILLKNDLLYISKPLNYFRIHTQNVRSATAKSGIYLEETAMVIHFIFKNIKIEKNLKTKIIWHFFKMWKYHIIKNDVPTKSIITTYKILKQVDNNLNKRLLKNIMRDKEIRTILFKKLKQSLLFNEPGSMIKIL